MFKKSYSKIFIISFFIIISIIYSSCATIMSGSTQKIPITTQPSGAKITIYDINNNIVYKGESPTTTVLKKGSGFFKKQSYRVVIEKEGYEKIEIIIDADISGWYLFGNFFLGGLVGWLLVDPLTGAMYTLNPDSINQELSKKYSSFYNNEKDLVIILSEKQKIPQELLSHLKKINIKNK